MKDRESVVFGNFVGGKIRGREEANEDTKAFLETVLRLPRLNEDINTYVELVVKPIAEEFEINLGDS